MRVERIERLNKDFDVLLELAEPQLFLSSLPELIYAAFDDDDRPCGILAADVADDRVLVKKLYVYPDVRDTKAAELLLRAAWRHTLDLGFSYLSYIYYGLPGEPCIYEHALAGAGFSAPNEVGNVWVNTGESALQSPVYKKRRGRLPDGDRIVGLRNLPEMFKEKDIPKQVAQMIRDDRMFSVLPGGMGSRSIAYVSGTQGVMAAILTANRGHYIHVYQLYLKSSKCVGMLAELFAKLTDISIKGYGSTDVRFINYLENKDKIANFEALMGDAPFRKCVICSSTKFENPEPDYEIGGEREFVLKMEILSDVLTQNGIAHRMYIPNNDFPYIIIEQGKDSFRLNYISDGEGKQYTAEMTTESILEKGAESAICREITQTYTGKKLMYACCQENTMDDVEKTVSEMIVPFLKMYC